MRDYERRRKQEIKKSHLPKVKKRRRKFDKNTHSKDFLCNKSYQNANRLLKQNWNKNLEEVGWIDCQIGKYGRFVIKKKSHVTLEQPTTYTFFCFVKRVWLKKCTVHHSVSDRMKENKMSIPDEDKSKANKSVTLSHIKES